MTLVVVIKKRKKKVKADELGLWDFKKEFMELGIGDFNSCLLCFTYSESLVLLRERKKC